MNTMKSHMKSLFLLTCCVLFENVHADGVHDILKDAVTCGIDPLGKIRKIVDAGSQFKNGYSTASYGHGTANTAIVILENPIEIAGATSHSIIGAAESFLYFDFGALVHGKFNGDYKRVVSELHLTVVPDEENSIGKYQRRLEIDSDGNPYEICPMTIGLTPLENGEFLLGCGWCNG